MVKCATEVARLHKVSIQSCTQNRPSGSSIALARLNLTFLPLGLSLWNLAHLFIMFMATKHASIFLIFAWGLSYGFSKSKKRGKIITKFWKIITNPQAKIKKSEATFCRSAGCYPSSLILRKPFSSLLSQLIKKLNSTEQVALFRHFCVSKVFFSFFIPFFSSPSTSYNNRL